MCGHFAYTLTVNNGIVYKRDSSVVSFFFVLTGSLFLLLQLSRLLACIYFPLFQDICIACKRKLTWGTGGASVLFQWVKFSTSPSEPRKCTCHGKCGEALLSVCCKLSSSSGTTSPDSSNVTAVHTKNSFGDGKGGKGGGNGQSPRRKVSKPL